MSWGEAHVVRELAEAPMMPKSEWGLHTGVCLPFLQAKHLRRLKADFGKVKVI
jgi:hypothetical protein